MMYVRSLEDWNNRNAVLCAINTALDFLTDPCVMMDSRSGITRQRLCAVKSELLAVQKQAAGVEP